MSNTMESTHVQHHVGHELSD